VTVANNQLANQTTFNNAFLSRTTNPNTIGKIDLQNTDHTSVTDVQRELNAIAFYSGKTLNTAATTLPAWTSNFLGASGDSLFDRADSISASVEALNGGEILFGQLEQSTDLYWDNTINPKLGIRTSSPDATLHVNGSICLTPETASVASGVLDGFSKSFLRITSYDAVSLETILFLGSERILLLSNVSGSDITIVSTDNIDVAAPVTWLDGSLILMAYDSTDTVWRILSGGGGGSASLYNNTFTGTTITATADAFQKWRYTGGSAQQLSALDFSAMPDGGRIIITGSNNTNTLLFIEGDIPNMRQNGNRTLYQYSTIEFIKDDTQLIEVSRNGI